MVSAPARRHRVMFAKKRGLSLRRACALFVVARSALHYESKMAKKDAPALKHMRELAAQYPRYGYRRIRIFLARRGIELGRDQCHRLWRQAQLQVPRKRPRKRVASGRPRPLPPTAANDVWAIDFIFDACADGRQLKCLTVIDEWTRECLEIDVAASIRSRRVIDVLARLESLRGAPRYLRSDNGPEFVSSAILRWLAEAGIDTAFIDPGKTLAERHRGELQRQVSRRVPQPGVVSQSHRGQGRHRDLAQALQQRSASLQPRRLDSDRVSKETTARNIKPWRG